MNMDALKEIMDNHEGILAESVKINGGDQTVVWGIASYAVKNGYEELSSDQKFHFNNCIKHLIENVQCSGYKGEFEEAPISCGVILDNEDLVEYYQDDGKLCESCEGQSSSESAYKESFFKER
jgi:hypothetical protein